MPENDIYYNRYLNPFRVKVGKDTLPDFTPTPHYLQLKSLCNEAYLKICTKVPLVYSIKDINKIIKEYNFLFEETEIWIVLYSAFDNFSFLYLELCELKVLIEDYSTLCNKALAQLNFQDRNLWLDSNYYLFKYIDERIEVKPLELIRSEEFLRINNCTIKILKMDAQILLDFYEIYGKAQIEHRYI